MFFMIWLIIIALLAMVLYTLYRNESASSKRLLPNALIEEYWSGKERRQHVRFEKSLEVHYVIRKRSDLKNNAKTVNISEGGMKLIMPEKLADGDIIYFKIYLNGPDRALGVEGKVVWSKDARQKDSSGKQLFYSGIEFTAIKEPSGTRLIDYIRSLAPTAKKY